MKYVNVQNTADYLLTFPCVAFQSRYFCQRVNRKTCYYSKINNFSIMHKEQQTPDNSLHEAPVNKTFTMNACPMTVSFHWIFLLPSTVLG